MTGIARAALLLSLLALPVQADTLYGIDVPGNLFAIDLATGVGTLVGVLPDGPFSNPKAPGYNEVEYDPLTGRAWAQQRNGNFAIQEFDVETGAGIGGPVPDSSSWHGLEYAGGTLYAAGFEGLLEMIPRLATLDPATGTFTTIGPLGLAAGVITGMAYDAAAGTMYGISGGGGEDGPGVSVLYTIDLFSGAGAPVGSTSILAGSLAFGPDGNLYAGGVAANQGELFRIDPATGSSTFVGVTGFGEGGGNGISGLTLPEPAHAQLVALGVLGLVAKGGKALARLRKTSN